MEKRVSRWYGIMCALALAACQSQDGVGPQTERSDRSGPESDWINWPLQKNAVFDPARINTSSAPALFSDDTVSGPPQPLPTYDSKPLAKAASATWTPITVGNANDVAIGWYYYFIDKATQKLKKGDFYNSTWTWTTIPGPTQANGVEKTFSRIAAAKWSSGTWNDYLVAITTDGAAYQWSGSGWVYMNGSGNGVDIAVNSNGDVAYLGTNYTLYFWNRTTASWSPAAGQAGLRLAMSTSGDTYLNSTGNKLWDVWWDAGSQTYQSKYMNAWTVNDVCSGGGSQLPLMHSGNGYSYTLSSWNPFGWTAIGGDSNTRNISCATNNFDNSKTTEFQTNNNGNMFYTVF
jgi:hypothetical protein